MSRDRVDACPGALVLHDAADGFLARVRLPGGAISAPQLRVLADAADELGDGRLELTSRGNIQLRALPAACDLAVRLADEGMLPSETHERVRNIVASPLSGIDGPGPDMTERARALDTALIATPDLADLPGRFLFALDDGRGDVAALDADIVLGPDDPIQLGIELAAAFQRIRGSAWRIRELSPSQRSCFPYVPMTPDSPHDQVRAPAGVIGQPDGLIAHVVIAPSGRLTCGQARQLADAAGPRGLRITPWRSVVVPDLDEPLAVGGLGLDADSPWHRLSACTGSPGCARSHADVQQDVHDFLGRWPAKTVRVSGCERRCGRPRDTQVDVIATPEGYAVVQANAVSAHDQ